MSDHETKAAVDTVNSLKLDADVLIVGGGPCGLVLAQELGQRQVATILLNDRPTTSPHPQAGATQARTMEHYRRLGLSEAIRAAGLPKDWPTDVAYFTRYSTDEIARLSMPSSGKAESAVRAMSGAWSAAELPHRCSQMLVEKILYTAAEKLDSVTLNFGWTVVDITDHGDHVSVLAVSQDGEERSFTAQFVAGADGARGATRKALNAKYEGEKTMDREFLSGQMYSVFFRSSAVYDLIPHRAAWQYWSVNRERRGMTISLNGKDEFVFVTQLQPSEDPTKLTEEETKAMVYTVMGTAYDLDIISRAPWTAGLALVSETFQNGRIYMGGDAAHLFTPTGGLGYNTAVDDAVNLGWKLGATVKGWGGPALLASYQQERQPLARRNTGYARGFADSIGRFAVPAHLEEDSERGQAARQETGDYMVNHARKEFNIPGITFGGRYDGSPIIVADGTVPPPDEAGNYQPTACPGGRLPHAWLSDERSVFDALGFEYSLLQLAGNTAASDSLVKAAQTKGIPITAVNLTAEGLRELYDADYVLVRPDQIVCWRGDKIPADPSALLDQISGN